jgi:hypothetical protein
VRKAHTIDVAQLLEIAKNLREWAKEIRRNSYPTSAEDAGLLEKAAKALEDACSEIDRLRSNPTNS